MRNHLLIVLVFVSGTLAGCLGGDDGLDTEKADERLDDRRVVTVVSDPEGDARLYGQDFVLGTLTGSCQLSQEILNPACSEHLHPVLEEAPLDSEGLPAPPSLDILDVRFTETPHHLIVEMDLSSLDKDFTGAVDETRADGDGDSAMAMYRVCWYIENDETRTAFPLANRQCTGIELVQLEGRNVIEWNGYWENGDCNNFYVCEVRLEEEHEYGSPGTLRWSVPRDVLTRGEEGDALQKISVQTLNVFQPAPFTGFRWYRFDDPEGAGPRADWGSLYARSVYPVDEGEAEEPFVFQIPRRPLEQNLQSLEVLDPEGDVRGQNKQSDVDLLSATFHETPYSLEFTLELAQVDAEPRPLGVSGYFGIPNGDIIWVGAVGGEGEWWPWVWVATDGDPYSPVIGFTVEPGSPGRFVFNVSRSDLPHIEAGGRLTTFVANSGADGFDFFQVNGGLVVVNMVPPLRSSGDRIWGAPPYRFQYDTMSEPVETEGGVWIDAPRNSAVLPTTAELDRSDPAMYDITHMRATPRHPGESILGLGIQDLGEIRVPTGYQAVVYAIGLETKHGDLMAGYYRSDDTEMFFCGRDTAVFTPEPRDPNTAGWNVVSGWLTVPDDGGPGEIQVAVPHDCIGPAVPDELEVQGIGAGTFLFGGGMPGEESVQVDGTYRDEPFRLHAFGPEPEALQRSWYEDPFGISEFWDIAGIVFAALLAIGGTMLWRRRRSLLRKYLAELQRAVTLNGKRPKALEEALVEIRGRLKLDLERDKIRDEHYVIIEHRIETDLSRARISGLEDVFGDLPHRLLSNLKEMLADGVLSQRDYRTLSTLLDESPLEKSAKTAIREKLARWLEQDNGPEVTKHSVVRP